MQKTITLILLVFYLIFIGCKNKEKQTGYVNTFSITDTITFTIDFFPKLRCSGSYFDKKHSRTLIYFSEPTTRKVLKIFDDNALELYSVNLEKAEKYLNGDVYNLTFFSLDTIVLSGFYNNRLAYINAQGELWKTAELNNLLQKDEFWYELHPASNNGNMRKENALLLYSSYIDNPNTSSKLSIYQWYKNYFESYSFFYIDNVFADTLSGEFKVKGLYKNLYNKLYGFSEPNFYGIVNEKIFVFTMYSDHFFVFDATTFELIKKVQLHSDYTKIGIEPIELTEKNINTYQDVLNKKTRRVGYVKDILYDEKTKNYLLQLHHENFDRFRSNKFSILLLDENFNKKGEVSFTDGKLKAFCPIQTDKGFMFYSNNNGNKIEEQTPKKFFIIDF